MTTFSDILMEIPGVIFRGMVNYMEIITLILIITLPLFWFLERTGLFGRGRERGADREKKGPMETTEGQPFKAEGRQEKSGETLRFCFRPSEYQISLVEKTLSDREETKEREEDKQAQAFSEEGGEPDEAPGSWYMRAEFITLLLIIFVGAAMRILNHTFLNIGNVEQILVTFCCLFMIAAPMTILVRLGDVDLSAAAIANVGAVVYVLAVRTMRLSVPLAVGMVVLAGVLCGVIKVCLVVRGRCASLLATAGLFYIFNGFGEYLSDRALGSVGQVPYSYLTLGPNFFRRNHWTAVIAAVFTGVLAYWAAKKTGTGSYAGKDRNRVRTAGHLLGSVAAALCGIWIDNLSFGSLPVTSYNHGMATAVMFSVAAICAVMLGGTSYRGRKGTLAGSFLGCILMALVCNGLRYLEYRLVYGIQEGILGMIFIAVLAADGYRRKKTASERSERLWL